MERRRPTAVLGGLCAAFALVTVPAATAPPATAQAFGPDAPLTVDRLPELRELPPLPSDGVPADGGEEESSDDGSSGVQTAALVLAGTVLVAGGLGLAVVTRRGRTETPADRPGHPTPEADR